MEIVENISVIVEETTSPAYFTVGPVPASDYLNVYFLNQTSGDRNIKIYDISGRQIFEQNDTENHQRIDISKLSQGIYTIVSSDGEHEIVKKFVK